MRKYVLYVVEGNEVEPYRGGRFVFNTHRAAQRMSAIANAAAQYQMKHGAPARYFIVNEE